MTESQHKDGADWSGTARDLQGYGASVPSLRWPNGAGLALNFVLNVEEGSEYSFDNGDGCSDKALLEVRAPRVPDGQRDLAAESMYEYGSRAGFWRLYRLFRDRNVPLTVFAPALAMLRTPDIANAIAETDWDICAHGWRWEEHYLLDPETEAARITDAYDTLTRVMGRAPRGWYCRYSASEATRRLVADHGGFLYDSDSYSDDVPYWTGVNGKPHLVVPYSMVTNDAKFAGGDVYSGRDYADFLIDSFEVLLTESETMPRMMSVGMHPRVIGHPGRVAGLMRFLDHVQNCDSVWIAGREAIAQHWADQLPADRVVAG
ncbi:polysaccharide deacetylase family protein [Primorskyibacter sedentarius]|uniref:polysaccharide deacetylase family protein n=1 Tax=Primorskyibacter sedentarius TaxID=745311 RepID=UPI003EB7E3F4